MAGEWEALPVRPVIDTLTGEPVRTGRLTVIREAAPDWFLWASHGRGMRPGGGTRHHAARSITEAQQDVQRWAQRRFRYADETTDAQHTDHVRAGRYDRWCGECGIDAGMARMASMGGER
jgi:hypothetical protein